MMCWRMSTIGTEHWIHLPPHLLGLLSRAFNTVSHDAAGRVIFQQITPVNLYVPLLLFSRQPRKDTIEAIERTAGRLVIKKLTNMISMILWYWIERNGSINLFSSRTPTFFIYDLPFTYFTVHKIGWTKAVFSACFDRLAIDAQQRK